MDIFSEVNGWSAEQFLGQFGLGRARDGKSFVCPVCDNGKGESGDGIKPRDANGQTRWKCFRCGKDFSNFDLAAAVLGYDAEREPAEVAKVLKERLGFDNDKPAGQRKGSGVNLTAMGYNEVEAKEPVYDAPPEEDFLSSRAEEPARAASSSTGKGSVSKADEKNTASAKEPKNREGLYRYCRAHYDLKAFVDSQGGKWRGLTYETLSKAGALYHAEYTVSEGEKAPVVILPYDSELYFWREVNGGRRGVSAGSTRKPYVATPISTEGITFVFEGELDALSAAQELGKLGIGFVATGGTNFINAAIEQIERQFGDAATKPQFVIVFDNDDAGITKAPEFVSMLKAKGYPAVSYRFEDMKAGTKIQRDDGTEYEVQKVDANDLLQRGELGRRLINGLDGWHKELKEQAAQMAADKARELQAAASKSGLQLSLFAGYFAREFFSDMERLSKYAGRKTGFANIDSNQVFMPGLYVIGALPAAGKTTFCWQLTEQLAAAGEPCVFCSFEMSRAELYCKSVARKLFELKQKGRPVMALTSIDIRRGKGLGNEDVHRVAAEFERSAINLQVAQISNMNIVELIENLKPLAAATDKSLTVVLDFLQIIPSYGNKDTKAKVDDICLRLKDFQRATNATIIAISSFNRENYRRAVSFEAFKESGAIEYSADCVWGLESYGVDDNGKFDVEAATKEGRKSVRTVRLTCLKNRSGGQYEIFFKYFAAHDYFEGLEEETAQDYSEDEE